MTSASASRVTRSRRSLRLVLLLLAGALAVATVLRAQEAAPPAADRTAVPAQGPGKPDPARDPADKDGAAPAGAPTDAAPQPRTAAPGASSPSRFEPTEKVRADFDVSFPIDI